MRIAIIPRKVNLAVRRIADAGGVLIAMSSLSQRGGERVAVLLANGLAHAGIPVRIALMRDGGDAARELQAMLHKRVSVVAAGSPIRIFGGNYLERARSVPFFRRQIRSFNPGVVLCANNRSALATALCRRPSDRGPSFALKLTNPVAPANMFSVRRLYRHMSFRFAFGRFDLAITLSESDRRKALEIYPDGESLFRTIPNAYVTDEMLVGPPPRRSEFPRILASSAMVHRKRLDLLLKAFAFSQDRTARLTILGDGPLRSELGRLALSLGIASRVELPGFTEDVVPWLRKSDLFVLPSDYEGLPAVVLEALACGVPVVSTDSFASSHELLDGLEGCRVVPTDNAEELARAIDQSINSTADPIELRRVAHAYLIQTSIDMHILELGRIVRSGVESNAQISTEAMPGVEDELAAANDDTPQRERHGSVIRRVALVVGLLSAGWLMHDLGPITSPARASTFVDDAVGAYRANLISDAMEVRPEVTRYDRAALAKATGIHMPRLPANWRVLDVEIFPRPQGVNLEVQTAEGMRLSIFGMKTRAIGAGYPVPDKRDEENVVYWGEGDFTFAVVGALPSKTLLKSVTSLDPDGPAIST